jgi:dethiobiotin synthetase
MKGIWITGTDTGVGKSVICGGLAGIWQAQGMRVITQKWVQTGATVPEDLLCHRALMGDVDVLSAQDLAWRCPYCLPLPASPHLAAAQAGVTIEPAVIEDAYQALAARYDRVLVEGAGGVMVPLTEELLAIDLVAHLGLGALVVVANRLGCINHALLTVEALTQRSIPVLGLIFNRFTPDEDRVQADNRRIIPHLTGIPVLGEVVDPGDTGVLTHIAAGVARELAGTQLSH